MNDINREFKRALEALTPTKDTFRARKEELLKSDPQTFSELVKMFILKGGKFSESDFIRFTGFGGKTSILRQKSHHGKPELLLAKQRKYISSQGCKWDAFINEWNGQFFNDMINEMDAINTICEILQTTREDMVNSFFEIPF